MLSFVHHIQNRKELQRLIHVHSKSVLVINFHTKWSSQSKIFSAEFERFSQKPLFQTLVFLHCHAEIHQDISKEYQIDKVPIVLFLKDGKVVDRLEGLNLQFLKRKLYHHGTKQYQCTYHLNASPNELHSRMIAFFKNTSMILFINSFHSNITWEFYALLDSLCATYEVFNVSFDAAVEKVLKKCWNITTYPQLFLYGNCLGNIEKVRALKNSMKNSETGGEYLRRSIAAINKLENCNTDPMAFATYRVQKLLQENKIVVFLENDKFKPCSCDTLRVLEILHTNGLPCTIFNVLQDLYIRKKVQSLSSWSTFPQVFVHGKFLGGVDNLVTLSGDKRNIKALKSYCKPVPSFENIIVPIEKRLRRRSTSHRQ